MSLKKKIEKVLFSVDLFGSPFQFNIHEETFKKNTKVGGIYSILMLIGIITFMSIRIHQWQANEISPTVIQYRQTQLVAQNFEFQEGFINITSRGLKSDDPNQIAFMPVFQKKTYYQNGTVAQNYFKFSICSQNNQTLKTTFCLSKKDIKLISFSDNLATHQQDYHKILILKCNQSFLENGQRCMQADYINQMLASNGVFFLLEVQYQRFNLFTRQPEPFVSNYPFYLDQKMYLATYCSFSLEQITYSNGISLKDEKYEFLSSSLITTQPLSQDTVKNRFLGISDQGFAEFTFSISPENIITQITKLSLVDLLLQIFTFYRFSYSIGKGWRCYSQTSMKKKIIKRILPKKQELNNTDFQDQYNHLTNIYNLMEYLQEKYEKKKQKNEQSSMQNAQKLKSDKLPPPEKQEFPQIYNYQDQILQFNSFQMGQPRDNLMREEDEQKIEYGMPF